MPHLTVDGFYRAWAVVGPLLGIVLGALLTQRWQRQKWILDNKVAEYRGILDALASYRFAFCEHYTLYKTVKVAVPAQKAYDDQIALSKALDAVTNAFADRIFTRQAIAKSGARNDWNAFAGKLLSGEHDLDHMLKMIDGVHDKLVKVSQRDLKLHDA